MKVLDKFWVAVLLLLTQGLSVWAADRQTLDEVTVTGIRRNNTEVALLAQAKESKVVVNTISAQEIRRTLPAEGLGLYCRWC